MMGPGFVLGTMTSLLTLNVLNFTYPEKKRRNFLRTTYGTHHYKLCFCLPGSTYLGSCSWAVSSFPCSLSFFFRLIYGTRQEKAWRGAGRRYICLSLRVQTALSHATGQKTQHLVLICLPPFTLKSQLSIGRLFRKRKELLIVDLEKFATLSFLYGWGRLLVPGFVQRTNNALWTLFQCLVEGEATL